MARDWKSTRRCSVRAFLLQQVLSSYKGFWHGLNQIPVNTARARIDKLVSRIPKLPVTVSFYTEKLDVLELNGFIPPVKRGNAALLYLHGGAYIAGSPMTTHRDLLSRLAIRSEMDVWAVNYRKAPENPFPAALEDACTAYQWLLSKFPANKIRVAGDSAGGGLALALLLSLRDKGLAMPEKLVLMSPLTDLMGTGLSLQQNMQKDVMVPGWLITQLVELYAPGHDPMNPYISPLYGEFHGFPGTLIQASNSEVLLDDARRVAEKMSAVGVTTQMDIWHNLPHVWQAFAGLIPEGRAAIEDIAAFLRN